MNRYLIGAHVIGARTKQTVSGAQDTPHAGGDLVTLPAMLAGRGPLVTSALLLGMAASIVTVIQFVIWRRK